MQSTSVGLPVVSSPPSCSQARPYVPSGLPSSSPRRPLRARLRGTAAGVLSARWRSADSAMGPSSPGNRR
eukprot:2428670-Pyramimonas_sp.AAC.1